MNETNMQKQVDGVRKATIELVGQQKSRAEDLELPSAPEGLGLARKRLEDNRYRIMVVGEAKRGKSSFINALIGREILPKDWNIATSQVFCVSQAEQEAYRVRFEDGSAQAIRREELKKYGAQFYIDTHSDEAPTLKDTIRWIEVDVPIDFLPAGVSILDTPGVGGLYAEHAEITEQFIPEADGVIFTLDPGAPVMQHEIEFIEAILRRTRNIFFIMTKADAFTETVINELIQRDVEILERKFGKQLDKIHIWPISSKNLLDSVNSSMGDALVDVSGYRELATALQTFLFRASGCSRARIALELVRQYQATGLQVLLSRRASLKQQNDAQQAEYRDNYRTKSAEFETDWGQSGRKFNMLMDELRKVVRIAMSAINQQFTLNGEIARGYEAQIRDLSDLDAAQPLAEKINHGIVLESGRYWRDTCEAAQQQCTALLAPFAHDCGMLLPEVPVGEMPGNAGNPNCDTHAMERLRNSAAYGMLAVSVLGFVFAAPVAILGGILAFFGGRNIVNAHELERMRNNLRHHMADVIQAVRKVYLEVDPKLGRQSLAEEYFGQLERVTKERVLALSKAKAEEARRELKRMEEAVKLSQAQRQQEYEKLSLHLSSWEQIGKKQEVLTRQLETLAATPTLPVESHA